MTPPRSPRCLHKEKTMLFFPGASTRKKVMLFQKCAHNIHVLTKAVIAVLGKK